MQNYYYCGLLLLCFALGAGKPALVAQPCGMLDVIVKVFCTTSAENFISKRFDEGSLRNPSRKMLAVEEDPRRVDRPSDRTDESMHPAAAKRYRVGQG